MTASCGCATLLWYRAGMAAQTAEPVRENLIAAARPGTWDRAAVADLFPRLAEGAVQRADTLSGGEQQMLTARALMTNPRLLLLGEATKGLAPILRDEIWRAVAALKASGMALLIVDKSVCALADRCVILARGADARTGPPHELAEAVAERHLGV